MDTGGTVDPRVASDYGRDLEFGASVEPLADPPDWAARIAKVADRSGLDLVGIQDHPYQRRFLDTWTLISTLVPVTERVRFFPDVANLPLRPPAMLAKAAASLDVLPGALTTALDWALRSPSPLRHKPVGIVGASPGGAGTARGQMVLRQILLHAPAYVVPEPQMLIPYAREKFDVETGDLTDDQTRERMRRFLDALVEWTQRLAAREPAQDRRPT